MKIRVQKFDSINDSNVTLDTARVERMRGIAMRNQSSLSMII